MSGIKHLFILLGLLLPLFPSIEDHVVLNHTLLLIL